jgi:ribA/ribD-fused uncharacterized protein
MNKPLELHGHDNENQIFFYEHDFYIFSNFSSFAIEYDGKLWPTSEHAYQAARFADPEIKEIIHGMRSAHEVFTYAMNNRANSIAEWDDIKFDVMKKILHAKVSQHPYVKKKLLDSGNRELIEDSWRDPVWGWGPDKDGQNMLGKLWMEVRGEVLAMG